MPKKTPGRRTQFIPRIFRERRCRAASASAWLPKGNPEPTTKLLPRDTQRLGAPVQFHGLPEDARDALGERAADLAEEPWDAVVLPPGDDPAFRERVFGSGQGILAFHVDRSA